MKIKKIIPKNFKPRIRGMLEGILYKSLESAAREQKLNDLSKKLRSIVSDITDQFSTVKTEGLYAVTKMRNHHAFQISLVDKVIKEFDNVVIADIGDSAGTHLRYILGLYSHGRNIKCLSVNIDKKAVERIRKNGLDAICSRAEDLQDHNIDADIFLCFQTLEHLMDPCRFLYQLSSKTRAKYLIITVPYLKNSRVGLHNIRTGRKDSVCAENTHIFEFDPEDWKLIIKHSGWDVAYEKIYLQYPRKGILRITRPLWRYFDLEGFYGLVLKRNDIWSSRYKDW